MRRLRQPAVAAMQAPRSSWAGWLAPQWLRGDAAARDHARASRHDGAASHCHGVPILSAHNRQRGWHGGSQRRSGQRGLALVTALFVVLMVSMAALAAARIAFDGERAARAERDRVLAFHAAEAALVDAEHDIEGGADPASPRAAMFHNDAALGFVPGCGATAINLALCAFSPGQLPAWQVADLAVTARYGQYTGAALPYGGPLPLAPPRYLIELMPLTQAGEDAGVRRGHVFRITAFGYGARPDTLVVLQAVYRSAPPAQEVL